MGVSMSHLTPELGAVILVALAIGLFVLRWPESGALLGILALYLNIPVLAVKLHSVPLAVGAGSALLIAPALVRNILSQRRRVVVDRPFLLMIVFFATALLSSFLAPLKGRALLWLASLLGEGLALYFVVVNLVRDASTLRRIVWILLLAGGLLGSLTVYQEFTRSYDYEFGGLAQRSIQEEGVRGRYNRARGPIDAPNRYAQILVVLLPLGWFCIKHSRSLYSKGAAGLCFGLILGGILFTYSRGGLIGLVTVAVGMIALRCVKARDVALGVGVIALAAALVAPAYVQRMLTLRGTESLFSASGRVEADWVQRARAAVMLAAWEVWQDHPLLGVGPGQFSPLYAVDYLAEHYSVARETRPAAAHCLYLQMGAELGVAGVGSFLAVVYLVLLRLVKVRRASAAGAIDVGDLAAAFVVALCSYLSTAVFLQLDYQRYFWLLLALGSAAAGVGACGLRGERASRWCGDVE